MSGRLGRLHEGRRRDPRLVAIGTLLFVARRDGKSVHGRTLYTDELKAELMVVEPLIVGLLLLAALMHASWNAS